LLMIVRFYSEYFAIFLFFDNNDILYRICIARNGYYFCSDSSPFELISEAFMDALLNIAERLLKIFKDVVVEVE